MNTFGPSASQQFPLYDPRSVRDNRKRFRREHIPHLDQVTSFYCTSGRYPSRGWILLARSDYNKIDKYSTTLRLNIHDTTKPDNVATLKNLSIVQAQCVTRGLASDNNALYLVELTDARGLLLNRWYQSPVTTMYNIRAPAYPQTFHPGSMNAGTTWTWETMLRNLWEQMTPLGTWPGLPFTPNGTPEGFWMPGVPIWQAFNDILDNLGMSVACNLTATSPFTIVRQSAADTTLATKQARYASALEEDLEWLDAGAGRVPGTVKVLFKRRNSIYGTEETVRYDNLQWDMNAVYSVSVNAPASFASATGIHYLWSDFTVRYDEDGSPLAADVTTATALATERVRQYYERIDPGGYMTRTYAGALPFATGSRVDGVRWWMGTAPQSHHDDERGGWRTQTVYGPPDPPWPGLWDRRGTPI